MQEDHRVGLDLAFEVLPVAPISSKGTANGVHVRKSLGLPEGRRFRRSGRRLDGAVSAGLLTAWATAQPEPATRNGSLDVVCALAYDEVVTSEAEFLRNREFIHLFALYHGDPEGRP